ATLPVPLLRIMRPPPGLGPRPAALPFCRDRPPCRGRSGESRALRGSCRQVADRSRPAAAGGGGPPIRDVLSPVIRHHTSDLRAVADLPPGREDGLPTTPAPQRPGPPREGMDQR